MKHSFVFALAAALAVSPTALTAQAHGQHHGSAEARGAEGRGYMFQRMQTELDLSADQVERLRAISTRLEQQNRPLMEQLRAAGVWSHGADRKAAGERRGARRAQATPEQREKMRAQMQERMQALTPEQRQQMRARMQKRMQRAVPAEMQQVLQQVRENSRVAMEEARAVLTAEQQARLSQLVAQRGQAQGRRPNR